MPVGNPQLAKIKIDRFLTVNVGDLAPDFTATTIDGKEVKLSELRGKVVLVDFWATWCAPCVAEMPNVKKAYEKFGEKGDFVVLGISLDEKAKPVSKFIKKRKYTWPQMVLGPAGKNAVAKQYNVTAIPAMFLIDREGKVVATELRGKKLHRQLRKLFPADQVATADK